MIILYMPLYISAILPMNFHQEPHHFQQYTFQKVGKLLYKPPAHSIPTQPSHKRSGQEVESSPRFHISTARSCTSTHSDLPSFPSDHRTWSSNLETQKLPSLYR